MGSGGSGYSVRPTRTPEEAEGVFKTSTDEVRRARTRNVFISFHVEDEKQVNLLREQARNEQFNIEFRDYSVKEPFDEKWKTNCRERIAMTSALICMIGPRTSKREAVDWEIREAYRQGKKIIGVKIHRNQNHATPRALLEYKAPVVEWNLAKISRLLEDN